MKIEIAYSIDRQVRLVQHGAWYKTEQRGGLNRWVQISKSQRERDELKYFEHALVAAISTKKRKK